MAHAFKTISAKPTFGTLKSDLNQGDYINRKKGLITFCKGPAYCNKLQKSSSYSNIYSFNTGRYARGLHNCNVLPINKSNLIIGQYTKLNITDICTVSGISPNYQPAPCDADHPCNPCQNPDSISINPTTASKPFYQSYQIDSLGELFGRSQCGELNYTNYMVFYPPTKTI